MSGARAASALIRLLSFASQIARGPREQPAPEDISRIVVLHMSGIGDLLLMTPALRALRRLYPRAHIDLITYCLSNAAFLFRLPTVRQGCEFPLFDLDLKSAWTRGFWQALERPVRFTREEPCDLYVSFHHCWLPQWYLLELWLAARSRARYKIGINPAFVRSPGVFDRALPESRLGERHYRLFFLEVVGLLGETGKDLSMEFPLEPGEVRNAQEAIKTVLPGKRRIICLHVGATHAAQLWPLDRFLELAKRFEADRYGLVLIGTKEERHLTDQLAASLSSGTVLDVAGTTTLFQMAAFIDASDLFIGNDSGPMHVAVARRRPTIGLISRGRTRYHRYEPDEAVMLLNPVLVDIGDQKDIALPWAITVDEVYAAAKDLLK